MYEYLQINFLLSLLALVSLLFLRLSPSRLKFYIVLSALCVWFIPWGALNIELPAPLVKPFQEFKIRHKADINQFTDDDASIEEQFYSAYQVVTNTDRAINPTGRTDKINTLWWQALLNEPALFTGFMFALSLGLILFFADIIQYLKMSKAWIRKSNPANHLKETFDIIPRHASVRTLNKNAPAMTSGFLHPVIWISSDMTEYRLMQSAITHESIHVRSHDHQWNWLIALIIRCFWWNPLVWYMGKKAKAYIEFSCDERSQMLIEEGHYARSLMRIILESNDMPLSSRALGIQTSLSSLNFQRVQALFEQKSLKATHIFCVVLFVTLGLVMSLGIAHDVVFKKLSLNDIQTSDQIGHFATPNSSEMNEDKLPFFRLAQAIYRKDFDSATELAKDLLQYLVQPNVSESEKILGFRVMSMLYGDTGQYAEIEPLGLSLLPKDTLYSNKDTSRIIAIADIKQGLFEEAINVIRICEGKLSGYSGLPSTILKAQAFHLLGDYEQSNIALSKAFVIENKNLYNMLKQPVFRLYGKNSLLLNDQEGVDWATQELGEQAPESFLTVQADNQSIPHVYFLRRNVKNILIDGFDTDAFPLEPLTDEAETIETQNYLATAIQKSNNGDLQFAKQLLQQHLAEVGQHHPKTDIVKVLEHLLLLHIQTGDRNASVDISKQLIELGGASRSMQARALWTLSIGPNKLKEENIGYFKQYVALFNRPSISADHEMLKRYYWIGQPERYEASLKAALERVSSFYQAQQVTPDIKIINRLIGLYDDIGDIKMVEIYKTMLERTYPKPFHLILE